VAGGRKARSFQPGCKNHPTGLGARRREIDGSGTFQGSRDRPFKFVSQNKARGFIAQADEDVRLAKKAVCRRGANGVRPWLDKKKLRPGRNWPRAIETAIQTSGFLYRLFFPPIHFEARQFSQRTSLCAES
jgi:hypothetical protein